jgi:hypothetical protein
MKKIIAALLFILVSNTSFAQAAFDKYDGQEAVASIIVNKKMFQMMGSVKVDTNDKETKQYLALMKKLDNLNVFATSNSQIAADMKITAENHMKSSDLEELIQVADNKINLKVWVKFGASEVQIKELLVFSQDSSQNNQTVLMSLFGNFSLNEIAILIDKMKIPGGENLKKATKTEQTK